MEMYRFDANGIASTDGLSSVPVMTWRSLILATWSCYRSPTLDPGDIYPEPAAQLDRGRIQLPFRVDCPELKMISFAVAMVAMKHANFHIDREAVAPDR